MKILKHFGLAAAVAAVTVFAVGCAGKGVKVTCTAEPASTNLTLPDLTRTGLETSQFTQLAIQAAASAEAQGYTRASTLISEVAVTDLIESLRAGANASSAFERVSVTNAKLASTGGTAVLGMTKGGSSVGSLTASYHVTNGQLKFDNPEVVNQWILSYDGVADSMSAGVPDLLVDAGAGGKDVTVAVGADYGSTEFASTSRTFYATKRACPRCIAN
jgi:hypothetical protein